MPPNPALVSDLGPAPALPCVVPVAVSLADQTPADQAPADRAPADQARAGRALEHAVRVSRAEPAPDFVEPVDEADVRAVGVTELRRVLDDVLLGKRPDAGLVSLQESGILDTVLPEVTQLRGFGDGEERHKDVWRHTLGVVAQSIPTLSIRWAALLHDIGKPETRAVAPDGAVHFYHHAEVGARMFDRLERRERLFAADPTLFKRVRFLILHHQRAHQYEEDWSDSAVRRLHREMGDALGDLMALSRADMTTKHKNKRQRFLYQLKNLQMRVAEIVAEDTRPKALPKGLGEALIVAFDLPPSKLVGDIRRELERAVDEGELPGQQEIPAYVEFVRAHPERFRLPIAGSSAGSGASSSVAKG